VLRATTARLIEGCRESCDVTEADRPGRRQHALGGPRSVFIEIEAAGPRVAGGMGLGPVRGGEVASPQAMR